MFEMSKEDKIILRKIMDDFICNLKVIDVIDDIKVVKIDDNSAAQVVEKLINSGINSQVMECTIAAVIGGGLATDTSNGVKYIGITEKNLSDSNVFDFLVGHELQHHHQGDIATFSAFYNSTETTCNLTPDEIACDLNGIKNVRKNIPNADLQFFCNIAENIVQNMFDFLKESEYEILNNIYYNAILQERNFIWQMASRVAEAYNLL